MRTERFIAQRRGVFRGGSGSPLVLLHAGGSSWRLWTPLLEQLTAERDVLAPTLPGHRGGPPVIDGEPLTIGHLADAVERELDSAGFECPDLVGNSIGGFTALELARRGRARRVVAIAPMGMQTDAEARAIVQRLILGHRLARAIRPALLPALAVPHVRRALLRDGVIRGDRVPTPLARHLVHAMISCDVPAMFEAAQALDGRMPRMESADEIHVPTLLIWGDRDTIATRDQIDRYLGALPDARLVTLVGAGHCPQLEEPDRVVREILDFTGRAARPRGVDSRR